MPPTASAVRLSAAAGTCELPWVCRKRVLDIAGGCSALIRYFRIHAWQRKPPEDPIHKATAIFPGW